MLREKVLLRMILSDLKLSILGKFPNISDSLNDIFQMKTNINFKQLATADLDINSNIEPLSKEIEQALSDFLKNRKKRKKAFMAETSGV